MKIITNMRVLILEKIQELTDCRKMLENSELAVYGINSQIKALSWVLKTQDELDRINKSTYFNE